MIASAQPPTETQIKSLLAANKSKHRVLWVDGKEAELKQKLQTDPELHFVWQTIQKTSDALLTQPPLQRIPIGPRLLETSRQAVVRTTHLGMAYRMTGHEKYARRLIEEMLSLAAFTDWGPIHFLDVAEMTTAMAFGFDWCRDAIDSADRITIQNAIIQKGLQPSLVPNQPHNWVRIENNWNQVCHCGLMLGAMAIDDVDPDLASKIIARAVECLPLAMKSYAPDGAYPEGPAYWTYGTTYNVMGISALIALLGTDFELSNQPGFLKTADYFLHVFGPSGAWFNYSDSPPATDRCPAAAAFYFARAAKDSSPLFYQRQWLRSRMQDAANGNAPIEWDNWDSQLPLLLLWAAPVCDRSCCDSCSCDACVARLLDLRSKATQASQLPYASRSESPTQQPIPPIHYAAHGPTPIATHRTSWDHDATYVAIKAGSAATSHAHMDAGSFVIDALGERFVEGIGRQDYPSLESANVDLWNTAPTGGRWKVFRMGPMCKNVLTVNGQLHNVHGKSTILRSTIDRTIVELSPVYKDQLASAQRGILLSPTRSVILRDQVTANQSPVTIRFAFVTRADFELAPDGAILKLNGKTMNVRISSPHQLQMESYSTVGPMPYDVSNAGFHLLGFTIALTPNQSAAWEVHFIPNGESRISSPGDLALW